MAEIQLARPAPQLVAASLGSQPASQAIFIETDGHPMMRLHDQLLWVRPVTRRDTGLLAELIAGMSDTSRWLRYFRPLPSAEMIWHEAALVAQREPRLGVALVATAFEQSRMRAVALAELVRLPAAPAAAELAVMVRDDAQRKGVGTLLLREVIALARQSGVRSVHATIQAENWGARQLLRKLGLAYHTKIREGELSAWAELP